MGRSAAGGREGVLLLSSGIVKVARCKFSLAITYMFKNYLEQKVDSVLIFRISFVMQTNIRYVEIHYLLHLAFTLCHCSFHRPAQTTSVRWRMRRGFPRCCSFHRPTQRWTGGQTGQRWRIPVTGIGPAARFRWISLRWMIPLTETVAGKVDLPSVGGGMGQSCGKLPMGTDGMPLRGLALDQP